MADEKRLPASEKKLRDLREKGQVPKSADITTTVVIAIFLFGLLYFGAFFGGEMGRYMISCFTEIGKSSSKIATQGAIPDFLNSYLLLAFIVLASVLFLGVILSQVLQTGVLIVPGKIGQQGLNAINPVNGVKQLFSPQRFVMTVSSIVKLIVIVSFSYAAIKELSQHNVFVGPVTPQELGMFYATAAWSVGWRILLALMIIATLDFLYQRYQYARDNRMSFQDQRDEHKQQEGSPELKGRMRGMARKMVSMRRMMENMSDATIVVTNPTHYAIALRYDRELTPAPIIVAKGMNLNARKIRERAAELDIQMEENKPLAQGLYKHGQVGKPIPVIYFQVVAQLLAELYRRGYRR